MTKSKAKSSQKGSGLPKKVAGVKVPKAVRESKSLGALLSSGLGREILADALIAAAGAAAAALTKTRTAQNAGRAAAQTGSDAAEASADAMNTAAGAVASVVTEAARNFLPASLVGGSEEPAQKPRYVHRVADHSERKRSKKEDKGAKGDKPKRKAAKKGM